jgi:hypothetical protein
MQLDKEKPLLNQRATQLGLSLKQHNSSEMKKASLIKIVLRLCDVR